MSLLALRLVQREGLDGGQAVMRSWYILILLSIACVGCRIYPGSNHLLLVTSSNSGFNADTVPTVIELSLLGRFDGVHAPSFEDAQTPPVVTSFGRQRGWSSPSSAAFASGPAALAVASYSAYASGRDRGDPLGVAEERCRALSEIELSRPPKFDDPDKQLFGPGEAPPMWFSTAESFGYDLEFFGPGFPPLPQSVHAGHRRKEFLATPLFISEQANQERPFVVRTPSVLALVNVLNEVPGESSPGDEKPKSCHRSRHPRGCMRHHTRESGSCERGARDLRRVQLFATGRAATRLASNPAVWSVFLRPLVCDAVDPPPAAKKEVERGGDGN